MDNEKLNNEELETTEELVEAVEAAEETVEAVTDDVAEVEVEAEAVMDDVETEAELVEAEMEAAVEELEAIDGIEAGNKSKVALIAGGAVAVVLAILAVLWYFGVINPYERGYIAISDITLEELADQEGYTISEYKKLNDLPLLMSKYTNENAVRNNISLKATIAKTGMTFDDYKEYYGWDDNVTEDSTVGEALGETKLSVIIGATQAGEDAAEEVLKSFKEYYGLGDDVTGDTLYKDIRETLDLKAREARIEEEKAAAEAEKEKDTDDAEADDEAKAEDEAE